MNTRPEAVQVIKQRRDAMLQKLVARVPYMQFLGIQIDRRGDELTAILPYADRLIGNPMLPALHGGATAAFLEVTAIMELTWAMIWEDMEAGRITDDTPPSLCPRPSTLPSITCAAGCRAMLTRGRA